MLKKYILFFVLFSSLIILCSYNIFADIAPNPLSRGATPRPKKAITEIQLKSETVNILVSAKNNHVDAYFELVNLGQSTNLDIGWPVSYSTDIKNLVVKEDGMVVSTMFMDASRSLPEPFSYKKEINRWYIWESHFEKYQKKNITVSYDVTPIKSLFRIGRLSRSSWLTKQEEQLFQPLSTGYILNTGRFWNGPIKRADINVFFEGFTKDNIRYVSPEDAIVNKNSMKWVFENFEPNPSYDIWIVFNPNTTINDEIGLFEEKISNEKNLYDIIYFTKHLIDLYKKMNMRQKKIQLQERIIAYLDEVPSEQLRQINLEMCIVKNYLFPKLILHFEILNNKEQAIRISMKEKKMLNKLSKDALKTYLSDYLCEFRNDVVRSTQNIPSEMKKYIGTWKAANSRHLTRGLCILKSDGTYNISIFKDEKKMLEGSGKWFVRDNKFVWKRDRDIGALKKDKEDANLIVYYEKDRFIIRENFGSFTSFIRK